MTKSSNQAVQDASKFFLTMRIVGGFIPSNQLKALNQFLKGEEGDYFREALAKIAQTVETMPETYGQDGMGDDAIVYLHYFSGGCDWYITEKDMEAEQHQAFGYANLGYGGELGYISLVEICNHPRVEIDLHWTPKELWKVKLAENERKSA